jgi:hypothetical protein
MAQAILSAIGTAVSAEAIVGRKTPARQADPNRQSINTSLISMWKEVLSFTGISFWGTSIHLSLWNDYTASGLNPRQGMLPPIRAAISVTAGEKQHIATTILSRYSNRIIFRSTIFLGISPCHITTYRSEHFFARINLIVKIRLILLAEGRFVSDKLAITAAYHPT